MTVIHYMIINLEYNNISNKPNANNYTLYHITLQIKTVVF